MTWWLWLIIGIVVGLLVIGIPTAIFFVRLAEGFARAFG